MLLLLHIGVREVVPCRPYVGRSRSLLCGAGVIPKGIFGKHENTPTVVPTCLAGYSRPEQHDLSQGTSISLLAVNTDRSSYSPLSAAVAHESQRAVDVLHRRYHGVLS